VTPGTIFRGLLIATVLSFGTSFAWPQEKGMRKRNPILLQDARLLATVNVDGMNRKIKDIIALLEAATQIRISVDENLKGHSPNYGSFQLGPTTASVVMDILEIHQLENGRWVKDGDGYLLTGKSVAVKSPAKLPTTSTVEPITTEPERRSPWFIVGGITFGCVAVGLSTIFIVQRRKRAARP
jgi:hypothetical protein